MPTDLEETGIPRRLWVCVSLRGAVPPPPPSVASLTRVTLARPVRTPCLCRSVGAHTTAASVQSSSMTLCRLTVVDVLSPLAAHEQTLLSEDNKASWFLHRLPCQWWVLFVCISMCARVCVCVHVLRRHCTYMHWYGLSTPYRPAEGVLAGPCCLPHPVCIRTTGRRHCNELRQMG